MNAAHNLDFQAVNSAVLASPSYLQSRLPDSRMEGRELVAGNIQGTPGNSFKINTETGQWADFATDERGGDVVSFVAAQDGIGQGEAARRIADELGLSSPAPIARKSKDIPEAPTVGMPTKIFTYFNPDGSQAYMVGRWEKDGHRKAIRPGNVDETGTFRQGLNGAEPIPYNLAGVADRPGVIESAFVVVVEGENKVEALLDLGICATCNTGGAGKWKDEYAPYFQDKDIVILPDNDKAGKEHAEKVAASLVPVAASVKVLELPCLPDKGDIIDWLKVPGNDKERLQVLMNDAPCLVVQKASYKVYSCADMLALPDMEWRVDDVLPTVGLASVWGPSKGGKSFLVLDMALSISLGSDWFGNKTKPCPVLYVNLEASRGLKKRLKAWMQETGNTLPDTLSFIIDRLDLQKPENVQAIIQAAPKSGMVVIDTLNRAAPCADENSSRDMGQIISAATEIQDATGGLVLIVTHTGKDEKKGARGHSSLFAALDAGIEVIRNGDTRTVKFDKVKDGEDGITKDFQLKKVTIGHSPDGAPVTSCVVEYVVRQEKEKALTPSMQYAIDSLIKACGTQTSVHLEDWRNTFYEGHTGDTHEAKRQAFVRARKDLVSKELASVKDDFYTPRQTRHNPDKNVLSGQDFNPDRQDIPL